MVAMLQKSFAAARVERSSAPLQFASMIQPQKKDAPPPSKHTVRPHTLNCAPYPEGGSSGHAVQPVGARE